MGLFVIRYNRYLKRNKLKHTDKGLVNFRTTYPPKKDHKKEDDEITCYECCKLGHYITACPNVTKHHKSKYKGSYKTKGKSSKGRRAYNAWGEEEESSSSDSCSSSDDEYANFCLMEQNKSGISKDPRWMKCAWSAVGAPPILGTSPSKCVDGGALKMSTLNQDKTWGLGQEPPPLAEDGS
ncbi:hypothetical protein KIW84_010999 [Lathyrus oleraceus]|uniref:CCHC-type domain-containing protein n=1 Tax=Pisum sativum TaxID=3888 RepID=A0A9D4YQ41_PEA|nr:hypothetical protein KIW84_010999 [Pisum sativum]